MGLFSMQEVGVKTKALFFVTVNASKKQGEVPVHSLKAFRMKRGIHGWSQK